MAKGSIGGSEGGLLTDWHFALSRRSYLCLMTFSLDTTLNMTNLQLAADTISVPAMNFMNLSMLQSMGFKAYLLLVNI